MDVGKTGNSAKTGSGNQLEEMEKRLEAERQKRAPGAEGLTLIGFGINLLIGIVLGVIAAVVLKKMHCGDNLLRPALLPTAFR